MKYASLVISALTLVVGPVAANGKNTATARPRTPGTVYRAQPDHGRVHVMDHQERIYVVSTKDPGLRCRNRDVPVHELRSGDKVWFTTIASR